MTSGSISFCSGTPGTSCLQMTVYNKARKPDSVLFPAIGDRHLAAALRRMSLVKGLYIKSGCSEGQDIVVIGAQALEHKQIIQELNIGLIRRDGHDSLAPAFQGLVWGFILRPHETTNFRSGDETRDQRLAALARGAYDDTCGCLSLTEGSHAPQFWKVEAHSGLIGSMPKELHHSFLYRLALSADPTEVAVYAFMEAPAEDLSEPAQRKAVTIVEKIEVPAESSDKPTCLPWRKPDMLAAASASPS